MADQLDNNNGFDITPVGKKPGTYGVLYKSLSDIIKVFKKSFRRKPFYSLFHFLITYKIFNKKYIMQHWSGMESLSISKVTINNNISSNILDGEMVMQFNPLLTDINIQHDNCIKLKIYGKQNKKDTDIFLNDIKEFDILKWGFEIENQDGIGITGIVPELFLYSISANLYSMTMIENFLRNSVGKILNIDHRAYYNTLIGQWHVELFDKTFADEEMDLMMLRAQNQDEKPPKERMFGQKKVNLDIG